MNLENPGYPAFDPTPATETAARRVQELAQTLRANAQELQSYYARVAARAAAKETRHS